MDLTLSSTYHLPLYIGHVSSTLSLYEQLKEDVQ